MVTRTAKVLPIPAHFDSAKVEEWKWKVPYQARAEEAREWARRHQIQPAATDSQRIALMLIDNQLTFSHPDFELYVGGRSGRGAIDDSRRVTEFIYRNLGIITKVHATMDTHMASQIFHVDFWVDGDGNHPGPFTIITLDEVLHGKWLVDPGVTYSVLGDPRKYAGLQKWALHYVKTLTDGGKYPLMVWPYHAILAGVGHCLVPAVEEAAWFHNIARRSQTDFQVKGGNPLTENYSVLAPEVLVGPDGQAIAQKNTRFIEALLTYDIVIIGGQAKSHCVAWTIHHLLDEMQAHGPELAKKVYLLEDCTSPVVSPAYDFTDAADAAFEKFRDAGMHIVKSTDQIEDWPDVN